MSEEQKPQEPVDQQPQEPQIPEGFVSQDVFERTKKDMFKYKAEAESAKKAADDLKVQRLKETQNWEALAKQREQEALDEKTKRERLESSLIQSQKFTALKQEALKHNIHPSSLDDLELLDLPEVNVETTSTGKILVTGAERAILNLKSLRPQWFQQKAPSINPSSPEAIQVNPQQVTLQDLSKLEAEYKKNPTNENKVLYFNAIKKFKTN